MKTVLTILNLLFLLSVSFGQQKNQEFSQSTLIDYFGDSILIQHLPIKEVSLSHPVNSVSVKDFSGALKNEPFEPIIHAIVQYKESHQLDDWTYYQLIRRTAQQFFPKSLDYEKYSLFKWFLLTETGYDCRIVLATGKLLLYMQSDDEIYDIPLFIDAGKQYVCMNIHDYGSVRLEEEKLEQVRINCQGIRNSFSFKINQIPEMKSAAYFEKQLNFPYKNHEDHYVVLINTSTKQLFNNYPTVDFETYFNIPICAKTYGSLIPELKKKISSMIEADGIDYLMHFTRNAFKYASDQNNFGKEKRLSPEQTLVSEYSDCDDRVALMYYLVKELYNLPMIVLEYPNHVNLGVALDKPFGETVSYNGKQYTLCEPTPQRLELSVGMQLPELQHKDYRIGYAYKP